MLYGITYMWNLKDKQISECNIKETGSHTHKMGT